MNIDKIKQIIQEIADSGFTEFSYKDKEVEVKLKRECISERSEEPIRQPIQSQSDTKVAEDSKTIVSPMVGTFYNAPSPESEVFVKAGDKVKKGQVIGIIEAMKLMNEIQSDYDGTVVDILVQNNQMVEYNQPLLTIKEKND